MVDLSANFTFDSIMGRNGLEKWIDACVQLTKPAKIRWCNGSKEESKEFITEMLASGELVQLNPETYPNCYLHRSNSNDVARTEKVTFICTPTRDGAGPTNNWMAPESAAEEVLPLFKNAMNGRTMYIIPYLMGAPDSPFAIAGVEITDSLYVVENMRIMTRIGNVALEHIRKTGIFSPGLHSLGEVNPDKRFIMHFPEDRAVWSIGSGYGGNALLGKKCLALRIGSNIGKKDGWMAEHMLILGMEDPQGNITYMAAAFPSACGKTNLAMLIPPEIQQNYKIWTVGDDIAWMRIGEDGRLWATNPEAGFFGVAPGTSYDTNPNAMKTSHSNSIFTNVALTPNNEPWWEGMTPTPPDGLIDWQNRPWNPENGPAAHPNSRFTAPTSQCPNLSPHYTDPKGVPISAIIFGGRRAHVAPLVYQSLSWNHGVYVGASVGSETTAAAEGKVGMVRRDPMAMLPFCGYNMADYFGHWVEMGKNIPNPPKIFHVNWFRKSAEGKFLWPGFGENIRVLRWIAERANGRGEAITTPIGYMPAPNAIDLSGLQISHEVMTELMSVQKEEWLAETEDTNVFLSQFGDRLPAEVRAEFEAQKQRLS